MKRILSLLLCLVLLLPTAVLAQPQLPEKEEVVYAKMMPGGPVSQVLVVSAFLGQGESLIDYGDYQSVQNLTDAQELEVLSREVQINSSTEDFYYQGQLTVPQMPWHLSIEYALEGKKISAEKLKGKDGDLKIYLHVRQNTSVDPVFFENYMLQISVHLDQKYFHNIVSEGATIASQGETRIVNLTSLPGKESSFVIEAQARNAHLGMIQVAGLPFELFMQLPDIGEYTEDLLQLQEAIELLSDGVSEYTSGAGDLSSGAAGLATGAGDLSRNIAAIAKGYRDLGAGHQQFGEGLRDYSEGMQEFRSGMEQLLGGIGAFTGGIDQLKEGSALLAGGLQTYSEGMSAFSTGADQSAEGSAQLTEGIRELSEGLAELTYQGKYAQTSLLSGSAQFLEAFEMMESMMDLPISQQEMQLLIRILKTFSDSFRAFVQNVEETDFDTFLSLLRNSLEKFDRTVGEIEAVADALSSENIRSAIDYGGASNTHLEAALLYVEHQRSALYSASSELRSVRTALAGLDPLIQGMMDSLETLKEEYETVRTLISKLNDMIQSVNFEDLSEMMGQLSLLSDGYRQFHGGLSAYIDGVESAYIGVSGDPGILSGSEQLSGGLSELAEGAKELSEGAAELAAGGRQLDEGIGELQEGAAQFSAESGRIESGVEELASGAKELSEAHGQILTGEVALTDGLSQYADGVADYYAGIRSFSRGVQQFYSGGRSLAGGMRELRDATSGMDEQMQEKMDEMLEEFMPSDYTLVSFADARNTGIQKVQFVYLSEAQEVEQEENTSQEEAPPKTLWDRFLDLFR